MAVPKFLTFIIVIECLGLFSDTYTCTWVTLRFSWNLHWITFLHLLNFLHLLSRWLLDPFNFLCSLATVYMHIQGMLRIFYLWIFIRRRTTCFVSVIVQTKSAIGILVHSLVLEFPRWYLICIFITVCLFHLKTSFEFTWPNNEFQ